MASDGESESRQLIDDHNREDHEQGLAEAQFHRGAEQRADDDECEREPSKPEGRRRLIVATGPIALKYASSVVQGHGQELPSARSRLTPNRVPGRVRLRDAKLALRR